MTRVGVIGDVRLYREGLSGVLDAEADIEVVAATAWDNAVSAVEEAQPDVVLVDVENSAPSVVVTAMTKAAPAARVVVTAVPEAAPEVIEWAEAGVAGYVTREDPLDRLVDVVRAAACGEAVCSPRIAATLLRRVATLAAGRPASGRVALLTPREREVSDLLATGLSNKEIGGRLQIELPTVKNHVHNILGKLEVHRRAEAVAHLRESGSPAP
jgi:two-component system, NarL family, nitrate/nitrite response regulator NarL